MSLMSSLNMMGSGLKAAQQGLYVTSHNMSNSENVGYCRQRISQADSKYLNAGNGMKVGTGVDVKTLTQVRNTFLDVSYRDEAARGNYHSVKYETIDELFTVMGEMNGESITIDMKNLWNSINTLSNYPESIDIRKVFINDASSFIKKANFLKDSMVKYQYNLDDRIRTEVSEINTLASKISSLNVKIAKAEIYGDHANDYRDVRNLLLDELSTYGKISVNENPNGMVTVFFENNALVQRESINKIGLRYLNDMEGQTFVEPVWTESDEILSYNDKSATSVYSKANLQNTNSEDRSDNGSLKALLTSRGLSSSNAAIKLDENGNPVYKAKLDANGNPVYKQKLDANGKPMVDADGKPIYEQKVDKNGKPVVDEDGNPVYELEPQRDNNGNPIYENGVMDVEDTEGFLVPTVQKELDNLILNITNMINSILNPKGETSDKPYDLNNKQGNSGKDLDGDGTIDNEPLFVKIDPEGEFTSGNIQVNPVLLDEPTKLALAPNVNELGDNSLIQKMLSYWSDKSSEFSPECVGSGKKQNFDDYYAELVGRLGSQGNTSYNILKSQNNQLNDIQYKRDNTSGVSVDEEMTNMIKYQHAYNASAKVYNVIDSMIQSILSMV